MSQLAVIDPKEFGLEEKKATEMTSGLKSIKEERNALETIFDELIKQELNQETLKQAKALRMKIRDNRTKGIEVWHKTNKAFYLAGGRFVDAVKNREVILNERMEEKLEEIETYFIKQEQEAKANLKALRLDLLSPYDVDVQFVSIEEMTEDQFNGFMATNKLSFETKQAEIKKAELDRIEAERLAEVLRLEQIEADRIERDRIEKENASLKTEQELAKIESDKQNKIIAEQKEKSDKLAAELKAKYDAEKLANEQEKARIEAEEADKLAKEKALLLAPDKDKVRVFFAQFIALDFPKLESEEGKAMTLRVNEALLIVKSLIISNSKKLL